MPREEVVPVPAQEEEDGRETFRVAVTVFCEVQAVDETDATHIAERAVKDAIKRASVDKGAPTAIHHATLRFVAWNRNFDVTVHAVREIGMALRNGYLWAQPTSKSFPTREFDGTTD